MDKNGNANDIQSRSELKIDYYKITIPRFKILFLDMDSVMITKSSDLLERNNKWSCAPMDKKCVETLNEIITLSGAEVIASTDWRVNHRIDDLREIFHWNGVIKLPIGYTPRSKSYTGNNLESGRADEIKQWVNLHNPEKWVAVDDMNMHPFLDNFVMCPDDNYGISRKGIKEEILMYL